MAYRVEIGSRADAHIAELDPAIGASVEHKIIWLAENATILRVDGGAVRACF